MTQNTSFLRLRRGSTVAAHLARVATAAVSAWELSDTELAALFQFGRRVR